VVRRERFRCPGVRIGNVAAYRFDIAAEYPIRAGAGRRQRCYLMFTEGMQLSQPLTFPESMADWWYVDPIACKWDGPDLTFRDINVDVIMGPPGAPYDVLDLDELAAAHARNEVSTEDLDSVMTRTQGFLDRHLNRRGQSDSGWPDFPPPALRPVVGALA